MTRLRAAGYDGPALFLLAAAAVGIAVAIYLTGVHYAGAPLYCSTTSVIDCGAVTTSRWSYVPGTSLPVSLGGIAWFVVSAVLVAVTARREAGSGSVFGPGRLAHAAWCLAGMVVVGYLVYVELILVNRVCEWCTVVHALTFLSLLAALVRLQAVGAQDPEEDAEAY